MQDLEQRASRILIVEDDEMLNTLLNDFLKSKGFDTLLATSVNSAKKILQSTYNIDLIILDFHLGNEIGIDLLAPDVITTYLSSAPVIMISVNDESKFIEYCFKCGANDYLIKPINFSLLTLKVEALIKSASMQRLIRTQKDALENYKAEAEREEQIAKFTYEYLLRQNSYSYNGVDVWLKSFAAFSGDMALVKKSPSGNLYFILADATGHGLSAAITILPVVTIFNSMVSKGFHIQKIVSEINRKLVADTPADRFVAAVLLEINPFRRELHIWNGGMPPLFWVDSGQVIHQFQSIHMALGIMNEEMFDASVITLDLPAQGFIFAYSDGLTEQENSQLEPFSLQRVFNIIEQEPKNLLQEFESSLALHAGNTDYADDVSICIIQPALVFADLQGFDEPVNRQLPGIPNCFEWSVKLSGSQLESCEIPPLCNHFLHQVGLEQQLCQKIFTVLAEMVSNAIDHGVLGLSSSIKKNPDGFIQYFYEREERLKILTDEDYVRLSIQWFPEIAQGHLVVEVEDSGLGYVIQSKNSDHSPKYSGRGSQLINKLSESVEIIPPGNRIRATVK